MRKRKRRLPSLPISTNRPTYSQVVADLMLYQWLYDDQADPMLVLPIEDHGVEKAKSTADVQLPGEKF